MDALYVKTESGLEKIEIVGSGGSGASNVVTETYSITEEATEPQTYDLGVFAHVLVFVNSVMAVDGDAYGIVNDTTLQFTSVLPAGTEVVVIKFVTTGTINPTPTFAIDSALSTTSQNAVQNKVVTAAIALKASSTDVETLIANALKQAKLDAHPVGSYYWSSESTSPADLFGGTWTQITDRFIYAAGSKSAGATGGEENHTLTAAELAAHGHNVRWWNNAGTTATAKEWTNNGTTFTNVSSGIQVYGTSGTWTSPPVAAQSGKGDGCGTADQTGGGSAHNNMPPYLVAYCWRRTA